MSTFNDRLREAMHQKRWRPADLARAAGITPGYISKILKGEKRNPTIKVVDAIANAIGVSRESLLEGPLSERLQWLTAKHVGKASPLVSVKPAEDVDALIAGYGVDVNPASDFATRVKLAALLREIAKPVR